MASAAEQIAQLSQVRKIVLADAHHYPSIISGVLHLFSSQSYLETQRWGAEFLAETFASPMVAGTVKEKMSLEVLSAIKDWLENQQDEAVLKAAIQTAASIYPYVFRHVTNNPSSSHAWNAMASIKSNILRMFDASLSGIRIVCIKFVQRVVQVQTPGIIADPRNEISAALVPRDHPIIPLSKLEAEASGLMDRLLSVFQSPNSDAIIVDATLNCLSVLVRTRQTVSNKIISAILSYNPFKGLQPPLSPKEKFRIRSLERTTRAFLQNIARRNEHAQFAPRIRAYCERNMQTRLDLEGHQTSKKRGPPEPTDGLDDAKRQRLGASMETAAQYPPMPPPPLTLAQVFSLTTDATSQFDAKVLPEQLVQKICVALLQGISQEKLTDAVNAVRSRLLNLHQLAAKSTTAVPSPVPVAGADEDEEYEPEFEPTEDYEQVLNDLDAAPAQHGNGAIADSEVALGTFILPQPGPVTRDEARMYAKSCVGRVFSMIEKIDAPAKPVKAGLNRLAGTHFDNEAWVTLITRLATRAPSNLNKVHPEDEEDEQAEARAQMQDAEDDSIADSIRETLFKWILADFRQRISTAISWLNEEWYSQMVLKRSDPSHEVKDNYETWTLRLLDNIVPYLDTKDKSIVRFVSEIPALSDGVFKRLKSIANDPDRAGLAVNTLHYLILGRPPVREQALDALEDLYNNYQGAAVFAKKVLLKWRPHTVDGAAVKQENARDISSTPVPPESTSVPPTAEGAGPILVGKDVATAGANGNPQLLATGS